MGLDGLIRSEDLHREANASLAGDTLLTRFAGGAASGCIKLAEDERVNLPEVSFLTTPSTMSSVTVPFIMCRVILAAFLIFVKIIRRF
jgi:hypothetical protein